MKSQYKYFLLAAEELNMSRAAVRAFISPQGMSTSIKQLENELGVTLFNRVPKLSLTPEGEALAESIREISKIKDRLSHRLADSTKEYKLDISIGILSCYCDSIAPEIVPPFLKMYPKVKLKIMSDFSSTMEQATRKGDLDFFIGDGAIDKEYMKAIPLVEEQYYLLISEAMLREYYAKNWKDVVKANSECCNLESFFHLPFIQYPPISRLGQLIHTCVSAKGGVLNAVIESNNVNTFPMLCYKNSGVAIVSGMYLHTIHCINDMMQRSNPLHMFPISKEDIPYNAISLAYCEGKYLSQCHNDFIQSIIESFRYIKDKVYCLPLPFCTPSL